MFKLERKYTLIIFLVVIIGLIMVYSSSIMWAEFKYNDSFFFIKRQIIFSIIGIFCYFIFSKINLELLRKYHGFILIISFISMILVLIPGIGVERNGSRSWFQLASIYIQPSEFLKFSLILTSASYLSKRKIDNFIHDLLPLFILVMISFVLIMLQPDFGSGIVMISSIVVMVFVSGCPFKYFFRVGLLGVLGLIGLIVSAPYRLERITSFLNPWNDPLGSGFQIIQSLYAISPGGLFGRGFGNSIQKQFYLPEPQTDFIFSIFAEEFGLIGAIFLIFLYFMIIYTAIQIIKKSSSSFKGYVGIGIISLFAIQVCINLGVVVGVFPVTGVTLPLFSYGGSSLVVMMSMLGIVKGIN